MEYAGFWRRNFAILIDTILFVILYLVLELIIGKNFFLVNLIYQPICAAYFIFLTMSSQQATLGQKVLKIKIVDILGNQLSLVQSALRYIVWGLPVWPLIIYSSTPKYGAFMDKTADITLAEQDPEGYLGIYSSPDVQFLMMISGVLLTAMVIGGLIWALPIAFTKEKTGIHDLICKQRAFKKEA